MEKLDDQSGKKKMVADKKRRVTKEVGREDANGAEGAMKEAAEFPASAFSSCGLSGGRLSIQDSPKLMDRRLKSPHSPEECPSS
jgi:hypothetical protein